MINVDAILEQQKEVIYKLVNTSKEDLTYLFDNRPFTFVPFDGTLGTVYEAKDGIAQHFNRHLGNRGLKIVQPAELETMLKAADPEPVVATVATKRGK